MGSEAEGDGSSSATSIDASARVVFKGTLVRLKTIARANDGNGLAKYGLVRGLAIAVGDTDMVRQHLNIASTGRERNARGVSATTLELLRAFEDPVMPLLRPNIAAVAALPVDELTRFADALVQVRTTKVRAAQQAISPPAEVAQQPGLQQVMRQSDPASAAVVGPLRLDGAADMVALNAAVIAARGFAINTASQPIGMLNLERIEMVPSGIQRGELVATIPLAPGEETAVTHKEWSVTSKEFTTIVTDAMEQTSETGVTDNTDLSQATTSQTQHSTQFNITGTVQGGIPMINGSTTAGVTAQDAGSDSAQQSIKHATAMTNKASARSRQEHKTTISTTTVTGTSETSTRMLKNTSATDPIRIDYFSLMRKWRVRLYRFGLRLTYDMVIPEPGAAMRRAYMDLEVLRGQQVPFVFDVKYSDVNQYVVDRLGNPFNPWFPQPIKPRYLWLADDYGVAVKPFPESPAPLYPSVRGDGNRDWSYLDLQFNGPPGTQIREMHVSTLIGINDGEWPSMKILGARTEASWIDQEGLFLLDAPVFAPDGSAFMKGATGDQKVTFWLDNSNTVAISLKVFLDNTSEAIEQWRQEAWSALYYAAQTRYVGRQQNIAEEIAAIEAKIADVDTLTLRREESDEIMKCILKFVLGAQFDFMPGNVQAAFAIEATDLKHGIAFDGQSLSALNASQWSVLKQHEDIVRFINQAIEWENVVTFLYSYFWDIPLSWPFIRALRHPDANRQAFLRAGSARVVLTVRKGWEEKWMRFVAFGTIDEDLNVPLTGPYLSIAQEIAAYDDRNYPGIPPANPSRTAARLQDAVFTTCAAKVDASASPVSVPVGNSARFVIGLPVVVDSEGDNHIQEAVTLIDVPDATHLVVDRLTHTHDGALAPFAVLQPGDKGALIAEWFEYTPSSGIDIALTSNLTTIA